jgi:hypothetical protein
MTISRRAAVGLGSVLAVTAGGAEFGAGALARGVDTVLNRPRPVPGTSQRVQALLIHPDEATEGLRYATISLRSHDTAWAGYDSQDDEAYRRDVRKFSARGYRLRRLSSFQTRQGLRHSMLWQLAEGPHWEARHSMTRAQFEQASRDFASRGYRISNLSGTATASGPRYAAIWERGDAEAWQSFAALTGADYAGKHEEMAALGFRPRHISGYAGNGQSWFAATFEKGPAPVGEAYHQMAEAVFREKYRTMPDNGYHLTEASGHVLNGTAVYSGIWEKA